jgi:hypothetical protein
MIKLIVTQTALDNLVKTVELVDHFEMSSDVYESFLKMTGTQSKDSVDTVRGSFPLQIVEGKMILRAHGPIGHKPKWVKEKPKTAEELQQTGVKDEPGTT